MGLNLPRGLGDVDEPGQIQAPLDLNDLMWSAACYVFWPILCLPLLISPRREVPFVYFHALQALLFGVVSSVAFSVISLFMYLLFRYLAVPGGMVLGLLYVGLFTLWLLLFLGLFIAFATCAYRAGRGDVFKLPFCGDIAENRVLASLEE